MKIVLIEDEFILAEELSQTLSSEGYEVVLVTDNGPEALDYCNTNAVDLILSDIHINGPWDGIETVSKINEVKQKIY